MQENSQLKNLPCIEFNQKSYTIRKTQNQTINPFVPKKKTSLPPLNIHPKLTFAIPFFSISSLQYHIHKVSIAFLIFLFHILFLLCNLAIFCHLKDKLIGSTTFLQFAHSVLNQQLEEKENPKSASSETEQSHSLWSRTNSISYNLNHFVTFKFSKKKINYCPINTTYPMISNSIVHFCLIFH